MRFTQTIFTALVLAAGTAPAHAQLSLELSPATQIAAPGSMLTFAGTLRNTSNDELFLLETAFTQFPVEFTLSETPFLLNAPESLAGGQSVTLNLFTVTVPNSAALSNFSGSFFVRGSLDGNTISAEASAPFTVSVQRGTTAAIPEPGTAALAAAAVLPLLGALRFRRRS